MHITHSHQFANSKRYIDRKRFPRLLPWGIASLLIYTAAISAGIPAWIQWTLLTITSIIIALIIWQEFARRLDMIEYPDCAICGSPKYMELFPRGNLGMVQCSDCGQVYARPRFSAFRRWFFLQVFSLRDALKCTKTDLPVDAHAEYGYRSRIAVIEKYVQLSGAPKLIDIGCACGQFLVLARSHGFQVSGIEPGLFGALCGRLKYGLNIHHASLERFSTADIADKYDVVCCFHVIEHVENPLEFLTSLKRLLNDHSFLILATPNLGCIRAKELGPDWEGFGPSDHIFLFDDESLARLCATAGFKVIESLTPRENPDELVLLTSIEPCLIPA